MTRRQEIMEFLMGQPATLKEITIEFGGSVKEIRGDLKHIRRSIRSMHKQMYAEPLRCNDCGKETVLDKVRNPSRCPECKSENILQPRFFIK